MKRAILSTLALLLLAQPARASLVCHVVTHNNTASSSCDTTSLAVKLIVLADVTTSFSGTPSDSPTNTYIKKTVWTCSNRSLTFYYTINPTTNASHTWNANCAGCGNSLLVMAFDNANPAFDQEAGNQSSCSGPTNQPGSITPGAADNLLVTAVGNDIDGSSTINSSFSVADTYDPSGGNDGAADAYLKQASATAQNPTWTVTAHGSSVVITAMLSFTFSGGSPPASRAPCGLRLLGVGCEIAQ